MDDATNQNITSPSILQNRPAAGRSVLLSLQNQSADQITQLGGIVNAHAADALFYERNRGGIFILDLDRRSPLVTVLSGVFRGCDAVDPAKVGDKMGIIPKSCIAEGICDGSPLP